MPNEIPEEYLFTKNMISNISDKEELIQCLGKVITLLGLIDSSCQSREWDTEASVVRSSAVELLDLVQKLVEKKLLEAA